MNENNAQKINLDGMLGGESPLETPFETQTSEAEAKQQEEIHKLKNDLLLALAENENLRKRHIKEREDIIKFSQSSTLTELTAPFENLFASLNFKMPEEMKENSFVKSLTEGVVMVKNEFEKVFTKLGLKRIYPMGEKFNPNLHQAVAQTEDAEKETGTIINVIAAGFELNGRLIRPAMVVISK